ncbi:unnamed protein product [Cyclocybe aegerita]|uniref:Phospholipase C/P1 nuclease n=1 Tax=Cyclocybe aegerita TaxID=1973307 RepID=A0A8S0XNW2_CYCAE|nr:unnamed protein product [Cyclocybe aegerita]
MRLPFVVAFGTLAYLVPSTYAWGAAGHEIVATIAQMYVHPRALETMCNILDLPSNNCYLARVATWADQQRMRMRWSASLHYVGALDDHPSDTCAFPGSRGWAGNRAINVLDGVKNTTSLLQDWVNHESSDDVASEALKFLIHFVGDMHQPLHLTGRDRGGNSVKVLFDRRHTNLHSLWDSLLIAKAVRTVPRNYSQPLPYPRIEAALRGTIYDSYVRRIMWEGVLNSWDDDLEEWLSCPAPDEPTTSHSGLLGMWNAAYSTTTKLVQALLRDGVEISPDGPVICPYYWSQPNHQLNCEIIWPKELDEPPFNVRFDSGGEEEHPYGHDDDLEDPEPMLGELPLLQLDTPQYSGVIAKRMILEKLLAQGGIRLAGILNYIFADEDELEGGRGAFLAKLVT